MPPDSTDPRIPDIILSTKYNTITEKMRSYLASWTYGIELELFEKNVKGISTIEQYIDNPEQKSKGALSKFIKTQPEKLQIRIRHAAKMGKRYRILDGWAASSGSYGISFLLGLVLPPLTSMAVPDMQRFLNAFLSRSVVSVFFKRYQLTLKSLQTAYISTSTTERGCMQC